VGPLRKFRELPGMNFIQGDIDALRIGSHESKDCTDLHGPCLRLRTRRCRLGFEPATVGLGVQPEGVKQADLA
jgi:hypothetical protein